MRCGTSVITWLLLCGLCAAQELPHGTPIKLTLLRPLESGKTAVGSNVPFAVAEDVVDSSGKVSIPKGSYAVGTVVASRAEGPLSAALLDRPARLVVRFDHVFDASGNPIPIAPKLKKANTQFELSREFTSKELREDQAVILALKEKRHKELLEKLVKTLSEDGFKPTADDEKVLQELLTTLEMRETAEIVRQGRLQELLTVVRRLANTRATKTLTANTSFQTVPAALNAVGEIVRVGTRGVGFLKGKLKGRNIRAYPGCDFTAHVAS